MRDTPYYSVRIGLNRNAKFDISFLRRVFFDLFKKMRQDDYFQESFGYYCVDAGDISGTLGRDIQAYVVRKLRKEYLWPIDEHVSSYSEDDVFDMIEFLYDVVSKPIDGTNHQYNNCGWHYRTFDQQAAREAFRPEINEVLRDYEDGFELSERGEIQSLGAPGLQTLLESGQPEYDPTNVEQRVENAVARFRYHRSSAQEKRQALRELGDVLEFLRPRVREILANQDESDLFNILNNFGIRHHNESQKPDYDEVFVEWLFYHYLAAIHVVEELLTRREASSLA